MPKIPSSSSLQQSSTEATQDLQATLASQFSRQPTPVQTSSSDQENSNLPEPSGETTSEVSTVLFEVPLSPLLPPSEFTVHVDIKLSPPQSTTIRRIASELDRRQARLKSGHRVTNVNGAIRWLMEQIE